MSAVIEKPNAGDRWAMLDFANLVFSQASRPHDFRALLPKMYAEGVPFEENHYIAREDGHIVGLTSALPYEICANGGSLRIAYVGTVSTHAYRRGAGFMKGCMRLLHEDMERRGVQLFVLGGLRQRYGYYGYSAGLVAASHHVTRVNVEKAMQAENAENIRFVEETGDCREAADLHQSQPYFCTREPARYLDFMHSWARKFYRIVENGATLGFCTQGMNDIELYDESSLLRCVKAWILAFGDVNITLGIANTSWNQALLSVAEHSSAVNTEMVRIVDWPRVVEFLLKVRARQIAPLQDGEFSLGIEGAGTLVMRVENGLPSCRMTREPAHITLSPLQAQSLLLSNESLILPTGIYNWLPLPLWIAPADAY